MLPNLNAYPLPRGASATEEIPVMSRLLVHETGHVVVAASAGIPTDYLIIDPQNGRHAGYIDESYRARITAKPALKSRLLAGGAAAEMATFGAAELTISRDDLEPLAEHLDIPKSNDSENWMKHTFFRALCLPLLLPRDVVDMIRPTYVQLVRAIEDATYLIDGAHVIPIEAYHTIALPLPQAEYWRARERTRQGRDRELILATLRAGAKSGG